MNVNMKSHPPMIISPGSRVRLTPEASVRHPDLHDATGTVDTIVGGAARVIWGAGGGVSCLRVGDLEAVIC